MADTVYCNGLKLQVHVGCNDHERSFVQIVKIDVAVQTDFRIGPAYDSKEGMIDYDILARQLQEHVNGKSYNLIEAVAEELCKLILDKHPVSNTVKMRVTKTPSYMPMVENVAVECTRTRADFGK